MTTLDNRIITILKTIFNEDTIEIGCEICGVDGYASFQRKVTIGKDKHLFLKTSDVSRTELGELNELSQYFCRNECIFYGVMMTILNKVIQQENLLQSVPKVHHLEITQSGTCLAMEDLSVQGFASCIQPLTIPDIKCMLTTMANLQVAFWKARDTFNYLLDDSIFGKGSKFERNLIDSGIPFTIQKGEETFFKIAPQYIPEKDCQLLEQYFSKYKTKMVQRTFYSICEDSDMLGLVHNDCWFNNWFIRRNDNGDPLESRVYDWQLWAIGNITDDFGIILMTSTTNDRVVKHFDELVEYYYNTFNQLFQNVISKPAPMSLEKFKIGCKESCHNCLIWAITTADTLLCKKTPIDPVTFLNTCAEMIRFLKLEDMDY